MPIRTAGDLFATIAAWFPVLAIVAVVMYFLASSLLFLEVEATSQGTEVFVNNGSSRDYWNPEDIARHREASQAAGMSY